MEGKYDRIVRQIVNDILSIFKTKKVGEYQLPDDLRETESYYDYLEFDKPYSLNLSIKESEDVDSDQDSVTSLNKISLNIRLDLDFEPYD